MRKACILILAGVVILLCSSLYAQTYHTPGEITQIMKKSPLTYVITMYEPQKNKELPDKSLNKPGYYQKESDKGFQLLPYKLSKEAEVHFKKAEEYYNSNKAAKARDEYLKALKETPDDSEIMTYIGQTYEMEKDKKNAKRWYLKAIASNYIDFMAHWFLADAYFSEGNTKDAVREITIANVLNRNNPRILQSLKRIYTANNLNYSEWEFSPKCAVYKKGNKVIVEVTEEWAGYALCKAVWKYEPGYRKKMTGHDKAVLADSVEETECLANLVIGYKNIFGEKRSKDEAINYAMKAFDNKMIYPFIVYEIWLPENPIIAYSLPKQHIEETVDYVLKIRTK